MFHLLRLVVRNLVGHMLFGYVLFDMLGHGHVIFDKVGYLLFDKVWHISIYLIRLACVKYKKIPISSKVPYTVYL